MTVPTIGVTPDSKDEFESLSYLSGRVHEEVEAAIRAVSVEATLIHVLLATAYAKRVGEVSAPEAGAQPTVGLVNGVIRGRRVQSRARPQAL